MVFMYVLGVLCSYLTLSHGRNAHLYENLWLELFLDTYLCAAFLTLLPKRVAVWVRRLFYVLLYVVAIVDVYCFWKFNSTLTPTMLMLVGETDSREAGEFLRSYVTPEVLTSPLGWIFTLIIIHIVWTKRRSLFHLLSERRRILIKGRLMEWRERISTPLFKIAGGTVVLVLLVWSIAASAHNKVGMTKLMTANTIGKVEHLLTDNKHGEMYLPVYRLAFSVYSNYLADQQIDRCIETLQQAKVDSCSFRSPTIVLIIGESYGRAHSEQYGYPMKTTPRQIRREHTQLLTPFSDVVSCWNLTSFVFKNVLSTHVVGEKGEWCDYPLFPELFRKAGYTVTFLTNQFLPKSTEAVYDFSGGFFLNDPVLSKALFDYRNDKIHRYDNALLKDYDHVMELQEQARKNNSGHAKAEGKNGQLVIFHLIGQHVNYHLRCPNDRRVFSADDYNELRPDLNKRQKEILADYDNAVHYNDSIVDAICKKFEHDDAIVIYMPDHGEECYEPGRNFYCRNHSAEVDWPLAHYEFEVPFWIYCTHKYAVRHPQVFKAVKDAKNRRFMTDALPHMLLWLAGIHTPYYVDKYNLLSPDYDEMRPRILKNTADYDKLREQHEKEMKEEKTKATR